MIDLILLGALVLSPAAPLDVGDGAVCRTYTAGDPSGRGGTVVLVPGLTGCAYGFRHVAEDLVAAGCRVVLIEPLGVGASSRPGDADYSLTAQADRLAAAMTVLGTGRSVVVAHGVAGSMAFRLAYRHPGLVGAVLSIEGGPAENGVTPAVEKSLGLAAMAAKLGAKRVLRDHLQTSFEAASGDRSWIDGLTVRRYFSGPGRDLSATVTALRQMAAAEEPELLRPNLGRISCPVVLLLGGADHEGRPTADAVALLGAALPDFRVQEVPGAGHFIGEEQPTVVVAAVRDLLGRVEPTLVSSATAGGGADGSR
jgi:pimeloyl-ACP methyl ester carboxylesterase